jgi:UDP-N-acetylmuramyl pentapeptide phosphotransferase/UDP-N-acetylglucosamine-1-phosphate transferase
MTIVPDVLTVLSVEITKIVSVWITTVTDDTGIPLT